MKRFYSKVDRTLAAIIWVPIFVCWIVCTPLIINGSLIPAIVLSLTLTSCTILIASIYTNTYYTIDNQNLNWRTGPFRGSIEIKNILLIDRYDSAFGISSTIKPSLTRNPLKVKYAKYDDMPFSPADEIGFIEELKNVNNEIEVSASDLTGVQAAS